MVNKVAWVKVEEWEFQKILKEIAEGARTGAHTVEKKNGYARHARVYKKPKSQKFNHAAGLVSTFSAQNFIGI
ncbi:MAG: hypothetical protein JSV50_18145 [Desulfobacteraceae bacterium]|nr:MAG: hypothetical protein JSV50_18145 [Desulfobacteraceae bacterium]